MRLGLARPTDRTGACHETLKTLTEQGMLKTPVAADEVFTDKFLAGRREADPSSKNQVDRAADR